MKTALTANELLHLYLPGKRTELVRGRLVVSEPPGFRHGAVTARLASLLTAHVAAHHLGTVVAGDAGFTLERNPDTVRGPDAAFIRKDRVPEPVPAGFAELAPDLVAEVLSPGDRPGEVLSKVGDWLKAGTPLVWVLDPRRQMVRVYRADGSESLLGETDVLEGEAVLPGFTISVAALFAD